MPNEFFLWKISSHLLWAFTFSRILLRWSPPTMGVNWIGAIIGYTSCRGEQDPGTTFSSDDTCPRLPNYSPSALAFANWSSLTHVARGNTIGTSFIPCVEKLSYSNYTFCFMAICLATAVCCCEEHILADRPEPRDQADKDVYCQTAFQAWFPMPQSLLEGSGRHHQLTIVDLSRILRSIFKILKQTDVFHPEDFEVHLISRV